VARAKKKRRWKWPASWSLAGSRPFVIAFALLLALSLLALVAPYVWVGALIQELGFHLALVAAAIAIVALFRRAWLAALLFVIGAGLFVVPLAPLYRETLPTPQAGPIVRVSTHYLAGEALPLDVLHRYLTRAQPDAVALTGLVETSSFGARVGPYKVVRGNDELRSVLLVQSALAVSTRERIGAHPTQLLRAGRCQARLVAVDLPPLAAYTSLEARARRIAALSTLPNTPRSVWFGHFGSRADAHDLGAFRSRHELRDGRLGHGRTATGPGALGPLGFPLSSVLVHGWISVRELDSEPPIVSGAHRSVRATLELTEARCRFRKGEQSD
jgi:hypothetical protein